VTVGVPRAFAASDSDPVAADFPAGDPASAAYGLPCNEADELPAAAIDAAAKHSQIPTSTGSTMAPPAVHGDEDQLEKDVDRAVWTSTGGTLSRRRGALLGRRAALTRTCAHALRWAIDTRAASGGAGSGSGGSGSNGCSDGAGHGSGSADSAPVPSAQHRGWVLAHGSDEDRAALAERDAALLNGAPGRSGYYQGLHDMAAVLLQETGCPALSAVLLRSLVCTRLRPFLTSDLSATARSLGTVCDVVARENAPLGAALRGGNPDFPALFALPWVITWFAHDVSDHADVARMFDAFLAGGPRLPLYACAALVLDNAAALGLGDDDDDDMGALARVHSAAARMAREPGQFRAEIVAGLAARLEADHDSEFGGSTLPRQQQQQQQQQAAKQPPRSRDDAHSNSHASGSTSPGDPMPDIFADLGSWESGVTPSSAGEPRRFVRRVFAAAGIIGALGIIALAAMAESVTADLLASVI
jgi:hypothetical protein